MFCMVVCNCQYRVQHLYWRFWGVFTEYSAFQWNMIPLMAMLSQNRYCIGIVVFNLMRTVQLQVYLHFTMVRLTRSGGCTLWIGCVPTDDWVIHSIHFIHQTTQQQGSTMFFSWWRGLMSLFWLLVSFVTNDTHGGFGQHDFSDHNFMGRLSATLVNFSCHSVPGNSFWLFVIQWWNSSLQHLSCGKKNQLVFIALFWNNFST